MNNFLICFTGIDGSGKTTQAKALAATLSENGVNSKYVWNMFQPFITKPFIVIARALLFRGKTEHYREYSNAKGKIFKNSLVATVYKFLLLFDYFLQMLLDVKIPLMLGKCVVCDRYIYDTMVNLAVELNRPVEAMNSALQKILHLAPRPDLTFLIDVPEEIAYQRKDNIPSIDFLVDRRQIYLNLGRRYGMVLLDGSKSIAELQAQIQEKVSVVFQWN